MAAAAAPNDNEADCESKPALTGESEEPQVEGSCITVY